MDQIINSEKESTVYETDSVEKDRKKIKIKKIIIATSSVGLTILIVLGIFFGFRIYNYFDKQLNLLADKTYEGNKESKKSENSIQYGTGEGMNPSSGSTSNTSGSGVGSRSSSSGSATSTTGGANSSTSGNNTTGSVNGASISISKNSGPVGTVVNVSVSGVSAPAQDCFVASILFRSSNPNYTGWPVQISSSQISAGGGNFSTTLTIPSQVTNVSNGSTIATPSGAGEIDVNFGRNTCGGALPSSLRATFTVL